MVRFAEFLRRLGGYHFPPLGRAVFEGFFRLLPAVAEVELFPGLRAELDFRDATMRGTYWQGSRFERPTAQILAKWAKAGGTHFFDIGSNYGFFSYWMLTSSPSVQVHAFEPNPRTLARVEEIKRRNGLARMTAWNLGLSDSAARLLLHAGVSDSGHSTFGAHPEIGDKSIAEVEVLPFQAWLERAGLSLPPAPRWIAKIDVEGFEAKVLRGLIPSLQARAFVGVAIEMNAFTLGFCGSSPEEVRDIFRTCGYRALEDLGTESGNEFFVPG